MLNTKNIFTLLGFKLTWLSCVFGELYYNSWFGFIVGIIFLIFFFYYDNNKFKSFKIILIFSTLGYLFDSILSLFNLYKIEGQDNFLYLPVWFLVLWPSFCTLLINVLSILKKYILLSAFFGAFIGPVTYYAGVTLGLANVETSSVFFIISIFWLSMMLIYAKYNFFSRN